MGLSGQLEGSLFHINAWCYFMKKIKIRDGFEGERLISLPEAVCTGFVKNNLAISQVYITHIGYFPSAKFHYRQRRHGCTDNILIYCLRGQGWYKIGQHSFTVSPNQYIIMPVTDEAMSYGADEKDPWTIYWVHFSGVNMEAFNRSFDIKEISGPKEIPLNKKGLEIWEEIYHILEMGFSKDNLRNSNLCLNHFLATFLFPENQTDEPAGEDPVGTTILYMRSVLHEKISVEQMAARLKLSTSYFSTLFRKSTGMPPIDYFIHLKIQKACQLLYIENMKVKDVAEAIGYDDPYHFSRLFKKHMKISPVQYKAIRSKSE